MPSHSQRRGPADVIEVTAVPTLSPQQMTESICSLNANLERLCEALTYCSELFVAVLAMEAEMQEESPTDFIGGLLDFVRDQARKTRKRT